MKNHLFAFLPCFIGVAPMALIATVQITEFMADNETTIATAAGEYEDWNEWGGTL